MKNKEIIWSKRLNELLSISIFFELDFFLDAGTLLGFKRNKKFIEWDNDIDLGLKYCKEIENKVYSFILCLYKKGWNVSLSKFGITAITEDVEINICFYRKSSLYWETQYYKYSTNNFLLIFLWTLKKGIYLDSFGYGLKFLIKRLLLKNKWVLILFHESLFKHFIKEEIKKVFIPAITFDNLVKEKFYGINCWVPDKTENYLSFRYGDSWREPRQKYNYFTEKSKIYQKNENQ
ncbi:MAG: LicD family protein [Cytophagaceae bacterium]|nr:LicD family protein [Cytophagaceae bacterium]